jgi:hypothetical protein
MTTGRNRTFPGTLLLAYIFLQTQNRTSVSIRQITQAHGNCSARVSAQLDRLVELGLVKRRVTKKRNATGRMNQRDKEIVMTEKGRAEMTKMLTGLREHYNPATITAYPSNNACQWPHCGCGPVCLHMPSTATASGPTEPSAPGRDSPRT